MPTVQGVFPTRQDAMVNGQAVKSRYHSDTGVVETAGGIGIGQAVARGTLTTPAQGGGAFNDSVVLLASGLAFLGISRRNQGRAATDSDKTPKGSPLSYFKAADGVAVVADKAIAATDVQVRFNTATGRFTDAAASGTVIDCTGWTFDSTTTAAAQLVVIKR